MNDMMEAWAGFLGTGKGVKAKKMTGSQEYTEPEFTVKPADKFTVGRQEGEADSWRGDWKWSICVTDETGPVRRSWLTGRLLHDGECMIHVGNDWKRGIHISEVPADAWHWILGAPHGGDGRIMGALKSKYTREAKKALAK